MAGIEKFYDGRSSNNVASAQIRSTQLKLWENSATNKQPGTILQSRRTPTIKFMDGIVLLAAAHSKDTVEVERLVREEEVDVNSVNKDGLTALHQCCIDDDYKMMTTLVKLKANLDIQDSEGWTPLHAATSCNHTHIVRYLLEHGAFPAIVNNEGDTPIDIEGTEDAITTMLQDSIDKHNIDMDAVRRAEEMLMLDDAKRLKNDPGLKPVISIGGATPLHVAASKNYLQVLRILLSLKATQLQVDAEDDDGWTALHAAVYWGNFAAAEQLVSHGADITKVNKMGDTIEDLCEPEFDDELNTLKKHCEQQQNNCRKRSNALSKRLIHTNSREEAMGKHPSPQIVRRRSSKERSLFPKIDIAKEREERENFTGGSGGEFSSESPPPKHLGILDKNHSPPTDRHGVNQNANSSSSFEARQEINNSTKNAQKKSKDSSSPSQLRLVPDGVLSTSSDNNYTSTPSSSDPSSAAESPASSPTQKTKSQHAAAESASKKKFPGMSPKMMLRVGQWESQKAITSPTTRTTPSGAGGGGRSGFIPVATSTPSNGDSSTPSTTSETKRYSFQAKTLSPSSSSSSLPPRSMSVDQRPSSGRSFPRKSTRDDSEYGSSHVKMSSLDDTNRKTSLDESNRKTSLDDTNRKSRLDPPEEGVKASSLPRGTKISGTSQEHKKEVEAVKKTEALATPSSQTDGSRLNTTRDRDVSRDYSREMSVESNTSSRGAAPDDSETSRKTRARKMRQTRKATQPVPADLFKKIMQHDEEEYAKGEELSKLSISSDADTTDGPEDLSRDDDGNDQASASASVVGQSHSGTGISVTSVKTSKTDPKASGDEVGKKDEKATMSSYRPSARPNSRVLDPATPIPSFYGIRGKQIGAAAAEVKMKQDLQDSLIKTAATSSIINRSPSPSIPTVTASSSSSSSSSTITTSTTTASTSSKAHLTGKEERSRTKSTTRRRPREKRRSTGIVAEVAAGEEVPEELSNLVRKLEDSSAASATLNVTNSPQSSVSEDWADSEEVTRLKAELEKEEGKRKAVEKELEETKAKVVELNRRCQDATRAYEQERRESEMKDDKIEEIQGDAQTLQDLKHENQRLKDENSALIRVIGKLSRSPLPQTPRT